MTIISIQFDYGNCIKYDILSRVLEYSIKKNCPNAKLIMLHLPAPKINASKKCFDSNTLKIEKWIEYMDKTQDNIVFLDCDMLVLKDFEDAFNDDFDIGLTVNGTGNIPYNGGVVFAKNTQAAKDFMRLWMNVNEYLYRHPNEHNIWRNKKGYAGMNQAALGCLLETKNYAAKIKKFPCSIWNLCRNNWRSMNDNSRILHVKSGLRRAVFSEASSLITVRYVNAINTWCQYANEAGIKTDIKVQNFIKSRNALIENAKYKLKRRRRFYEKTLGRNHAEIAKKSKSRRR